MKRKELVPVAVKKHEWASNTIQTGLGAMSGADR